MVALTEFGACLFRRILYTAYRGVPSIFGKPHAPHLGRLSLSRLPPAPLDKVRQLKALAIVHRTEYEPAQYVDALTLGTCTDWSGLSDADPGGKLWMH